MTVKNFIKYSIIFFGIFYSNISKSDSTIYFIDVNFLMNNSLVGESINNQLSEIRKSTNNKLKKTGDKLKEKEMQINSQKNILSNEEYSKIVKSFSKEVEEYNISRNETINNITKIKKKAEKNLLNSLTKILTEYSEKNLISYILPKQNIIIGKTELDLTDTILKILNSKIKNIKVE
ncbi:OmpH family outer membrane protein [Candidatus Pelagibacter sp.]|nr:OmpH family outer membrane protein [Candidatus Pelagibacter sp.]